MLGANGIGRMATTNPTPLLLLATLVALIHVSSALIKATRLLVSEAKDFRWPNKQVNLLIDPKTLNSSEQLVLKSIFEQLEQKTCVRVNELPLDEVNPFEPVRGGLNFIYVFKSQVGSSKREPSLGLSSFGCVKQGRQSLVLTDSAFKWPELVLRYHVLRSLGVEHIERPDGHVRRLLNMLPLSQKITSEHSSSWPSAATGAAHDAASVFEYPTHFAYATTPVPLAGRPRQADAAPKQVCQLSDEDLAKIKQLYECPDYQNRLSPKPLDELASDAGRAKLLDSLNSSSASAAHSPADETLHNSADLQSKSNLGAPSEAAKHTQAASKVEDAKLEAADESLEGLFRAIESSPTHTANESLIGEAARQIVNYLLATDHGQQWASTPSLSGSVAQAETEAQAEAEAQRTSEEKRQAESEARDPAPPADGFETLDSLFKGEPNERSLEGGECRPLEACPLEPSSGSTEGAPYDADGHSLRERPMLLKLDHFHALDPELKQANQMKLSRLSNDSLASYRLMNHPASLADMWPGQTSGSKTRPEPKSEMLISFEQSPVAKDPVTALASSQVLKLCSCQCQTMTPSGNTGAHSSEPSTAGASSSSTTTTAAPTGPPSSRPPPPHTQAPTSPTPPTYPTDPTYPSYPSYPTFSTSWPVFPTIGPVIPTDDYDFTLPPLKPTSEQPIWPPETMLPPWPTMPATDDYEYSTAPAPVPTGTTATTDTAATTTATTRATPTTPTTSTTSTTSTVPPSSETSATTLKPEMSTQIPISSSKMPLLSASACEQVEWVQPNKSVYASARIVWDVDRANQNYFLCNNQLNGELIPGKTHGFSCKISQEGRAFEAHQFKVLTKPEQVNLAWVQRNSNSFGRTNFPVVGGYSKERDPYIVSRCLVKDENNDVITLIGYINNRGLAWFPFDDIQIECAQYDVLACVN